MQLIPLSDRIILEKVNIEVKTQSGIILSAGEVEEDRDIVWGRVLFVGPGKHLDASTTPIPMTVKVGDLVAFNERMPLHLHYRGQYIFICRESDILMINKDTDVIETDYQPLASVDKSSKFLG